MSSVVSKTNGFLLALLVIIGASFAVSYYRYIHTLDYDLFLAGPCDPATQVCVLYEEEVYGKYLVHAQSVAANCAGLEAEACVERLREMNLAAPQDCEAYLDEGESCTNPEDYTTESTDTEQTEE